MTRDQQEPNLDVTLAGRAGMYRLLSALWRRELDEEVLSLLCVGVIRESYEAVGGVIPVENGETLEALAIDYCQLFLGPKGQLPRNQSVWHSGQFCGSALDSARKFAELVGVTGSNLPAGMLEDHFSVQLDVMARLLDQVGSCDSDQRGLVEEVMAEYFATHLSWPGRLSELVMERSSTAFYTSLAVITGEFLESEQLVVIQPT